MRAGSNHPTRQSLIQRTEDLLDQCRIERVPVDLLRIARHLGIQRIRELDIRLDGQLLEFDDGSYEVILSRNAPHTRKRFTLAHEIGHILVAMDRDGDVACGDGPTEELCNSVAAELLLPGRFLLDAWSDRFDVPTLRQIATRFQCSLEATGWRTLNIGGVTGALLIWRDLGDAMELTAAPRTFGFSTPYESGDVIDRAAPVFENLSTHTSGPVEFKDRNNGRIYTGDYVRLNRTLLMFVQSAPDGAVHEKARPTGDGIQGKLF